MRISFALAATLWMLAVAGTGSAQVGEGEPEEAFGGVGVVLSADPVFMAVLQAFQTEHGVVCGITAGHMAESGETGGTFSSTWTCLAQTPGEANTWAIEAAGFWTPSGETVLSSLTFSAAE